MTNTTATGTKTGRVGGARRAARWIAAGLFALAAAGPAVPASAESGGPDNVGYVYSRTNSPGGFRSIVNAAGAVRVVGGGAATQDDTVADSDLGFAFPLYDSALTDVRISVNGLVVFDTIPNPQFSNVDLTTTSPDVDRPSAAVYWDDLVFLQGQPGSLWFQKRTSAGVAEFVAEWDRAAVLGTNDVVTVQAVFRADGTITYHYPSLGAQRGAGATIGIRDIQSTATGRRLQFSFNSATLNDGDRIDWRILPDEAATALEFSGALSPRVPTGPATAGSGDAPVTGGAEGRSVWFRWRAQGAGTVSFSTQGSDFDTVLAVHRGTPPGLEPPTVVDDDSGPDGTSRSARLTCYPGEVFSLMVAGKGSGASVTSGFAQVSATFASDETIAWENATVTVIEGRTASIQLRRRFDTSAALDVAVTIVGTHDGSRTVVLHAEPNGEIEPLRITPPDDGTYTPSRGYTLLASDGAGSHHLAGPACVVEVLDDDPIRVAAKTYSATLSRFDAGSPLTFGRLDVAMRADGSFSGRLAQSTGTASFSGRIDSYGRAVVQVVRKGVAAATVTLVLREGAIFAAVADADGVTRNEDLVPRSYGAGSLVPAEVVGRYTVIGDVAVEASPGVIGCLACSFTVAPTGAVKGTGTLLDGSRFSFRTDLLPALPADPDQTGRIEAHALTYGRRGFVNLRLRLSGRGVVTTYRPAGVPDPSTTAFDAGFLDVERPLTVARYERPAGALTGDFFAGFGEMPSVTVTIAASGKVTSDVAGFSMRLDPASGLFRGTRPNAAPGGAPIRFAGVLTRDPVSEAPMNYYGCGVSPASDAPAAVTLTLRPAP